jgi:hypothetical protein
MRSPRPAYSCVEHIERLGLVLFHRSNCFLKHGLSFFGSALLACLCCFHSCKQERCTNGRQTY